MKTLIVLLSLFLFMSCVSIKEVVREGITGSLADSGEEWLDKITIFLEDKRKRKQIGEGGRLRAKESFSYEAVLPKFLSILNSCV